MGRVIERGARTITAIPKPFVTKAAAVAGIAVVREFADMGLIADPCTATAAAEIAL